MAVVGRLNTLDAADVRILHERGRALDPAVAAAVAEIISEVAAGGDDALRALARRFDGADITALEVSGTRRDAALAAIDPALRGALEQAADAIAGFHRALRPPDVEIEPRPGLRLGRRGEPLRRVGVYVPGGRAAYPSSVLMGVIPARVAGVDEVIVCTPPGPGGAPADAVLAAASIAGADRVFAIGGAGAIAAMAYGTASVPAVQRIVGPGNAYVTEAKQQLTRRIAIDCPAGPSEILILADDTADAGIIAVEVLAQAEHDPDACCVLVTTSEPLLDAVRRELAGLIVQQPRRQIIERALASSGALLLADDIVEAVAFAERYAPEHLLVLTQEPAALLTRLRSAGTIFLGAASSVAFGDYMTGANHVLPTGGLARSYAGLSTTDFLRFSTYQQLDAAAAGALAAPTATLADAEGLPAHAYAARLRAQPGARDGAPANVATRPLRLRPEYRAVSAYDPGRTPCDVDLSDNTNLWGANPAAVAAVHRAGDDALTRYPPVYVPALKTAIAEMLGVDPKNVTTGCGSDDVIDSAMRAFCAAGDVIAYPEPTFGMVGTFARMNVARPVPLAMVSGVDLDVDALLGARAAVTYVCRPNNPTGTLFDAAAVARLDREAHGVVLVDEAYIDFAREAGVAQVAATSERTIALRTFSKAFGLAGLRVGFAVGPEALIAEIEKSRGPYKVSALAEQAALAVLATGREWTSARTDEVVVNRERLAVRLMSLGLRVVPSTANFLLVPLPRGSSARDWNVQLRARGVGIRPFPGLPGLGDCMRVTIGPWPMMERFLAAIEELMSGVQLDGHTR